jgi:hypothetical protein
MKFGILGVAVALCSRLSRPCNKRVIRHCKIQFHIMRMIAGFAKWLSSVLPFDLHSFDVNLGILNLHFKRKRHKYK